jgi:hypothetical protein
VGVPPHGGPLVLLGWYRPRLLRLFRPGQRRVPALAHLLRPDLLHSGKLIRESESQARRGDLAFYGSGHVEFFVRPGHTFGALETGTRIGWHATNAYWHPTMFFRVRGAR